MLKFVRALLSIWLGLFYRVKVVGVENVPLDGAAVLCANHTYYKDLVLLSYKLKRKVRWMAKSELFKNPLFGGLITRLGAFPVARGKNDRGAVKTLYGLLAKGDIVGIFPEGTRSKGKSEKAEVKRGFVSFAIKAKVPIIPATVVYGRGPLKGTQLFSKIKVVFHEPVLMDFDKHYSNEELSLIGKEIMNIIYS
jgi:1-acyl-sn-glycerol-3-phosphate acyltransferase